MFHWFGVAQNDRGDALVGWQIECVQESDGQTVVPIFSDANSTPIASVSGVADRAVTDRSGNYELFVPSGTYSLRFYNSAGLFQRSIRHLSMYGAENSIAAESSAASAAADAIAAADAAASALASESAAELARDVAIAAGVQYPTEAAAVAALAEGAFGSYLNALGNPVWGQRTGATMTPLPGPWIDADKIGLVSGDTVQEAFDGFLSGEVFYSRAYPTLAAAFDAFIPSGGTLVINSDHSITAPIVRGVVDGKAYRITSDKRRKLTYTGTATGEAMIRLNIGAGVTAPIEFDASLEFDADQKAAACLAVLSDALGNDRANFIMRGEMVFRNSRSLVGSGYEANGFLINGGYKDVSVQDFEIYDISAPVGATVPGSRGCRGFQIFGTLGTTKSAERVFVGRHKVVNVVSDETPGTSNYTEMDNIIFQSVEGAKQAPIVENGYYENCPGRAIKIFAPFGGGIVRNIRDVLSVPPVTGGSPRINLQHGTGTVENCEFTFTAGAAGGDIIPVSVVNTAYALPSKPVKVSGINIDDATGTTHTCLIGLRRTATSSVTPVTVVIENVRSNGLYETLFLPGGLGSTLDARVVLDQINVRLTQAIIKTNDAQSFLRVTLSNFHNTSGTTVPARRTLPNAMATASWGDFEAIGPCTGLAVYYGAWRGVSGWSNGVRGQGVGGVEAIPVYGTSEISGRCTLPAMVIAAGASVTVGPFGQHNSTGGDYSFEVRIIDGNSGGTGFVRAYTGANSQSFTSITNSTPASIILTNGGTPVGTASTVEIVKTAGQALTVHNYYATARTIQIVANP